MSGGSSLQTIKDFVAAKLLRPELGSKLDKIAGELKNQLGVGAPAADKISTGLVKVLLERLPEMPDLKDLTADKVTSDLLKKGITLALASSGVPAVQALGPFTVEAFDWIINHFQDCGATKDGNPPLGNPVEIKNGRHVITVFIEEMDVAGKKVPKLPPVQTAINRKQLLLDAIKQWEDVLAVDILQVFQVNQANLIVTSESFAGKQDPSVLAICDIGPPGGIGGSTDKVCTRLVFDQNKTFTESKFFATASHEMGHALGVKHADVGNATRQLMNPVLSDISSPQPSDIAAAISKGWKPAPAV